MPVLSTYWDQFKTKSLRYGTLNQYDIFKLTAICLMIIDHLGLYWLTELPTLRLVGRLSFPLFFFLIGYSKQYRWQWDLVFAAICIALLQGFLHATYYPLNILFSIIFIRFSLKLLEKSGLLKISLIATWVGLVLLSPTIIAFDYGTLGVMFAICGVLKREETATAPFIMWTMASLGYYALLQQALFNFSSLGLLLLCASLTMIGYCFYQFNLKAITTSLSTKLEKTLLWLSRHSLFVYLVHLSALLILSSQLFQQSPIMNLLH